MRTAFNPVQPKDWPLSAHVLFFSKCMKFLTRSIGLSNRITNSPDHRLASRKFLSFWPGSRTFPITDCHLDHCMERWNERIGIRKRSVSYQPPGKQTTDSCAHFLRNCLLPPILILNCRRAGIVQSTILHLFNRLPDRNPFDRAIDWNLYLPPLPRQSSSNLASRVWMLLQIASFFSHFAATFFDASARNFTRNGNCSGKACSLLI